MLQTALVSLYRRTEELIVANGNLAWEGQTTSVTETVRVPTRVRHNKDAANLLHVINAASILQSAGEGG